MKSICVPRAVGSKFKLGPTVRRLAPIEIDRFIEPFAYTATVTLNFFAPLGVPCHINDINSDPMNFCRRLKCPDRAPPFIHQIADLRAAVLPENGNQFLVANLFQMMKPKFPAGDELAYLFLNR